jgi:hypothetical protein
LSHRNYAGAVTENAARVPVAPRAMHY